MADPSRPERRFFKPLTTLLLALIPVVIILCFVFHVQFGVVALLLVVPPPVVLFLWWRPNKHVCPLEHVLSSYAVGFWMLGSVATFTGYVAFDLCSTFAILIIGALVPRSAGPVGSYIAFVGSAAAGFGGFIAVEEFWKLNFTRYNMVKRQHRVGPSNAKAYVIAAASASLGHASALSLILSLLVAVLMGDKIDAGEFGDMVLFAFIFASASMPLNVLTAYVHALELQLVSATALNLQTGRQRRSQSEVLAGAPEQAPRGQDDRPSETVCMPQELARILYFPVAVRTAFAVNFGFWPAVLLPYGSPGIAVAVPLVSVGVVAAHAVTVRRIRALERELPAVSSTSLQRFGYALLAGDNATVGSEMQAPYEPESPSRDPGAAGAGAVSPGGMPPVPDEKAPALEDAAGADPPVDYSESYDVHGDTLRPLHAQALHVASDQPEPEEGRGRGQDQDAAPRASAPAVANGIGPEASAPSDSRPSAANYV